MVLWLPQPAFHENAVLGLQYEVLRNVVQNYERTKISPDFAQVFNRLFVVQSQMLSVESVTNEALLVQEVNYRIRVVFG